MVQSTYRNRRGQFMDLGIVVALVMLAVWAVVALGFSGPGWIHILLTLGIALFIWRVVDVNTRKKRGRTK